MKVVTVSSVSSLQSALILNSVANKNVLGSCRHSG